MTGDSGSPFWQAIMYCSSVFLMVSKHYLLSSDQSSITVKYLPSFSVIDEIDHLSFNLESHQSALSMMRCGFEPSGRLLDEHVIKHTRTTSKCLARAFKSSRTASRYSGSTCSKTSQHETMSAGNGGAEISGMHGS